jgi:hypothetical protein
MAVKNVTIVVEARDEASKTIKGIGSALSTAVGTFVGGAALKIATKGFEKLTGVIGDCIGESRDAAKAMAQTRSVIKSTGGIANVTAEQIADTAGSLSHLTLFTDDAIQAQENLLLTFTNVRNEAGAGNDIFKQATEIGLDMAQALGTDAAAGAVQLGKALNDPVAGIGALSRVGVTFTADQKEMIKGMVEAGNVMGAQKVILAELNKEFGGSAAAAAAADGGFHLLQQRFDDVKQTIGDELMPVLQTFMGWLAGPGMDIVERWGKAIATGIRDTAVPAIALYTKTVGDLIFAMKNGQWEQLRLDLSQIFGAQSADWLITKLREMGGAWDFLADGVTTFKQAWAGDWKNAENILPLHSAIGKFGLAAKDIFDGLTTKLLPDLAKQFATSMPENQRLVNVFLAFMNDNFFPDMKDGLNAAEKQTRDYGVAVGESTGAAQKSWSDYLFSSKNDINDLNAEMARAGKAIHDIYVIEIPGYFRDAVKGVRATVAAWTQVGVEIGAGIVAGLLRGLGKWAGLLLGMVGGNVRVPGGIVGSGTPGGQSVIGPQAAGMTARGVPLYLPSGFSAPPSSSVAPRRAGGRDRPAVSLDFRGASFGAGLDEPQLRGWITPILQDALERFETGMMRDTSDLATRGALR